MANLSSVISSQARSVRRGPQTPQWWTLFQVALGAVVFIGLVWSLMSTDTSSHQAVRITTTAPSPTDLATPTGPASSPSAPASPSNELISMPSTEGAPVSVPKAAADAARLAFEGAASVATAARVPMATGETFPAPTQDMPEAVVGKLQVGAHTDDLVSFVATFDPDGRGPAPASYLPWTTVRDGERWVVTLRTE